MDDPTVTIHQGVLRGSIGQDHAGEKYYSFLGIPYAKPPLGDLRFKAPRPPEGWSGIRNAFEEGDECYSRHPVLRHIVGSEDCLFLNVFTPELPNNTNKTKELKPVMVWIHGGGFNAGSSKLEFYGPEFLLPEDIVFVSFNYRLGVLGFLALDDPELGVPGNAGLKDMVMALKWVQNNIHFFMGDPNNVTIFGQSAGAAAVHYLVLSPMAKGLFHRAIAQSGCALNSWAQGRRICWELAKILECNVATEKELLKILKEMSVEKLFAAQEEIKDVYYASELRPNGPVIEKTSKHELNFLVSHPIDILLSGNYNKVPMIFGYATREGMILALFDKKTAGEIKIVEDFETTVPVALGFSKGSYSSKLVAQKIKQFYFGSDEPGLHNLDKYYMVDAYR
ncbi:esterase FE4-like isoform X1 [Agrilus planipennis]|uniref:Esterase FE4-like isoform X1 n=1 Tax=Agrilus planipennis TaxID=224129 RepID=A0A1W4XSJ2_AGRPL|nr:esterase FE4-like isoform X1 [Agrilus planipennis]